MIWFTAYIGSLLGLISYTLCCWADEAANGALPVTFDPRELHIQLSSQPAARRRLFSGQFVSTPDFIRKTPNLSTFSNRKCFYSAGEDVSPPVRDSGPIRDSGPVAAPPRLPPGPADVQTVTGLRPAALHFSLVFLQLPAPSRAALLREATTPSAILETSRPCSSSSWMGPPWLLRWRPPSVPWTPHRGFIRSEVTQMLKESCDVKLTFYVFILPF